jgi:hypothetical protein
MHYVELIALKPLCGDYGRPERGHRFKTDNVTAQTLESTGSAERYYIGRAALQPPPNMRSITEILAAILERQEKMQPPLENKMITVASNKVEKPKKKRGRPAGSKKQVEGVTP